MTREIIVNQAKSWIGKKESDGSHHEIVDIYNSHKPLAKGYKVKYTDSWCATFVSAVAIKCGATDIIPTECSCPRMIALFQAAGTWCEDDAYTPKPGDVIFYDWQDSGKGDNHGNPNHVGIVEKVVGDTITVIEGNKNDAVGRRTIKVNGKYIRGYGLPKYDGTTATPAKVNPTPAPTPATTTAKAPTYTVGKVYTLNTELKVRSGPGTKYRRKSYVELTSSGRIHDKDRDGALDKGTRVSCLAVRTVGSDIWIRCPSGWLAAYYKGNTYISG